MRHSYFGKKLSRTKNERRRLLQSLARELFVHGGISTSLAKAKAVQPLVEKLITKAKKGGASDLIAIRKELAERESVNKLLADAKTRFSGRNSGFTRIIKLDTRISDHSKMAHLSFVDAIAETEVVKAKPVKAEKVEKAVAVKKVKTVKAAKPKTTRVKKG
jgi:large subunit ribosomal protein L17